MGIKMRSLCFYLELIIVRYLICGLKIIVKFLDSV